MKILPITKKQTEILLFLYQFRFLNTHHIQKLLSHKTTNRSLLWLKDLIKKGYVKRLYEKKSLVDKAKPAIYFLAAKSRSVLRKEKKLTYAELEYIYSEHKRDKKFINHCLFLADFYFYLLSQKGDQEEITFFTKTLLRRYEYFPKPLPDAFIVSKNGETTQRYFLDFFDEDIPFFVMRRRVRMYFDYVSNGSWEENTDSAPFPAILLISPTKRIKKQIYSFAKAKFEREFEERISIFLTTSEKIQNNETDIWEKVTASYS